MSLPASDFNFVRSVVHEVTGNEIGDDKSYLVESRLQPLVIESGQPTLNAFVQHIRQTNDREWQARIAQVMLNTETYFFREPQTLDYLAASIVPELLQSRGRRSLRLWSAACSTGQEVYSIALLLAEHAAIANCDVQITGSDVCTRALEQARGAEYSTVELNRNLPSRFRSRFRPSRPDRWRLEVQNHEPVRFEICNLISDVLPGPWDVVFLRNVLIYFDDDSREAIFRRIHAQLAPDGWLILGTSESYQPPQNLFHRSTTGTACFQNKLVNGNESNR